MVEIKSSFTGHKIEQVSWTKNWRTFHKSILKVLANLLIITDHNLYRNHSPLGESIMVQLVYSFTSFDSTASLHTNKHTFWVNLL